MILEKSFYSVYTYTVNETHRPTAETPI